MNAIYETIKANATNHDTATLLGVVRETDTAQDKARKADDIAYLQSLNMIMSAVLDVIIDRDRDLDLAIDVWCEECNDERSMAQFVLDYFAAQGVKA